MSSGSQHTRLCDHCNHTFSKPLRSRGSTTLNQLRTNYIPNDQENEAISRLLFEVEADLESYDTEINRLENIVLRLKTQRAELELCADDCRCLQSSPIRRLPVEVLGQVFVHCIPKWPLNDDEPCGIDAIVGSETLRLGLVCAKWRDIVLSSKSLWAMITVNLDAYQKRDDHIVRTRFEEAKDILDIYVQRSGNAPLSVTLLNLFSHSQDQLKFAAALFEPILTTLASQSSRWRRATMMVAAYERPGIHWHHFWNTIAGTLPELEELKVRDIDTLQANPFASCPKLRTLVFSDFFFSDFDTGVPLPWDQITVIQLQGDCINLQAATERCPLLTHLDIDGTNMQLIWFPDHTFHCAHLESISLSSVTWGDDTGNLNALADFLDIFTTPCLKLLRIGCSPPSTHPEPSTTNIWPTEAFASFISRSSCSLDKLCLENIPMSADTLLAILTLTPALTSLKIHEIPVQEDEPCPVITDTLLQALVHSSNISTTLLVPRLTHIELKGAPFFSDQVLLDMLESRWQPHSLHSHGSDGVACLDFVALSYTERTLDPACLSRLRVMNKEGLKTLLD